MAEVEEEKVQGICTKAPLKWARCRHFSPLVKKKKKPYLIKHSVLLSTVSVLVFPPVSNHRRFLIHKCVGEVAVPSLATFSIGAGDDRRTVICYADKLLSDVACAKPTMGLSQADLCRGDTALTRSDAGECKRAPRPHRPTQPQEKIRSASAKPRRPDRAVYVPRALRSSDVPGSEENLPPDTRKRTNEVTDTANPTCPKTPREKSLPGTPRRSLDKNFCNVYTPPHLRNQRSRSTAPSINDHDQDLELEPCDQKTDAFVPSVPNSDSAIEFSDNGKTVNEIGDNFYIGDYFANGQLGLYHPNFYYSEFTNRFSENDANLYADDQVWEGNDSDEQKMAVNGSDANIIDNGYAKFNKDEDVEDELRRASQEINRSGKKLIKQTFNSHVLVISDPIEEPAPPKQQPISAPEVKEPDPSPTKPKPKLEAKVSLKREENDWDDVFDDSGECLDQSLLEELTATVGKVQISKAKNDYGQYQTKGQSLCSGPIDESFAHVVEVFDFPTEFKTNDLLSVFSEYKDTGFEIKWVDDTHALIVFSSAKIAAEVLSMQRPLVRCRPLHAATSESKSKAKKCAEFLQPYRQRPETCTALARRLVSGALGVKLSTASQERAEERRLITIAREKKRQAALHKEAAWDGSLGLADT